MGLILVFDDSLPLTFPHSTSVAAKVVSSYGSTFAKDVVSNRLMLVADKAAGVAGVVTSHAYARSSDGTVNEIARNVYTVDANSTKGAYSVGCLKKSGTTSTIENVMEADHESFVVSSTSAVDDSLSCTTSINYEGVQFSTNTAAMYFGQSGQFRIRFGLGDGPNGTNSLSVEARAADGSYVTKQQFSDGA